MPENVKRYPQPDGTIKVINIDTGESFIEGVDTDKVNDAPRSAPFGTPAQAAKAVELPAEKQEDPQAKELAELRAEVARARAQELAAKKAELAPDMAAQLSAEADRQAEPVRYPAGSPELKSLLRLPFRQRATAMQLYQSAIDAWNNMPSLGTDLDTPDKLERYFGALSAFDDFLECVAANKSAYRSWVESTDDSVFGALFFAYVSRFGLGEAVSSSS